MSTGVKLSEVGYITATEYGFNIHDWDSSLSRRDIIMASCDFKDKFNVAGHEDISEFQSDLTNQTPKTIAKIFNAIFQKFHYLNINGFDYEATSIQIGVIKNGEMPSQPFFHVCGKKV